MESTTKKKSAFGLLMSIGTIVLLTSIHHIYGAIHYQTPWRLHTLHINIPLFLTVAFLLFYSLKERPSARKMGKLAVMITIVTWIIWVGLYEGVYNHLIKDILFFSGLSGQMMLNLFPPPTYEMPNDVFFEVTGILQIVPLLSIIRFSRLVWRTGMAGQ